VSVKVYCIERASFDDRTSSDITCVINCFIPAKWHNWLNTPRQSGSTQSEVLKNGILNICLQISRLSMRLVTWMKLVSC